MFTFIRIYAPCKSLYLAAHQPMAMRREKNAVSFVCLLFSYTFVVESNDEKLFCITMNACWRVYHVHVHTATSPASRSNAKCSSQQKKQQPRIGKSIWKQFNIFGLDNEQTTGKNRVLSRDFVFGSICFLVWCERVLCWEPREIVNKMQKNEYHSVIGIFGKISCAYCFCFLFGRMFVTRLFSNCYLCVCVCGFCFSLSSQNQSTACESTKQHNENN